MIVIATVGLPHSGKSTWRDGTGYPFVCPDEIRKGLQCFPFDPDFEPLVWRTAYDAIRVFAQAGTPLLVFDSTATTEKRRSELQSVVDAIAGCALQFKVFDTPRDECVRRAQAEGRHDLVPVILKMARDADGILREALT